MRFGRGWINGSLRESAAFGVSRKEDFTGSEKQSIQFCIEDSVQQVSSHQSLSCFLYDCIISCWLVDYEPYTINLRPQNLWMIGICFHFELKHMLLSVYTQCTMDGLYCKNC